MIPVRTCITRKNPHLFPRIGKDGGVYNRSHGKTVMVNCIIAGNFSEEFGGGTCNAAQGGSETILDLHNALIAGNETDTNVFEGIEDDGGGHFNRDGGQSTLINCTIVGNKSGGAYGGVADTNPGDGKLQVRNCIAWGNEDVDGNTGLLDEQVAITGTLGEDDVDNSVIEGCTDCFKTDDGNEDNIGTNPDAVNVIANPTWIDCTYDAATGITTFEMTVQVSAPVNETLFQPDSASPLQLLIKSVDETNHTIRCYGNWGDLHIDNPKTGTIFDYHIATGSSAIDFGDTTYLADAADPCDLNGLFGKEEPLPLDLDLNDRREQGSNPDSGAYEIE